MMSLSRMLSPGKRRAARMQRVLHEAYTNTFAGTASPEQAEIVLVDLAQHSGYYYTCSPEVSTEELRCREGKRALFARIVTFLNLPSEALNALQAAVMAEDGFSQDTGIEP